MTVTESLPVVDAVRRELELDEQIHDERTLVRTVLTLTTNITRSPAQLWPLLTRPEQLDGWFGHVSGELREGGTFDAPGGEHGSILRVEAPHRLSLTWQRGDTEDPLTIRLDPEDDGTTELRLRHATLIEREDFDRFGPGLAAVRWEIALLALAAVTDGWRASCLIDVPAPTPAWLGSAQGTEHVRAWSVRWAAQSVAAGVDEATARRGEQATARVFGA
jgi:uncharacterized protein YndB with AHSA1/START domain